MSQTKACLVTGAAGFIGSHLVERLLADGHRVVGVDRFSDYYDAALKRANVAAFTGEARFRLVEADLASADLADVVDGTDAVFHLAAQAGVRQSWGSHFDGYVRDNIVATQRLLEALRDRPVEKLVLGSTSSVYGDAETLPTAETVSPRPVSPYGVTKLAAEHLCGLYHQGFGVPVVVVRYFTVYGPRQRPDMAFNRFIESMQDGSEITIFGDGAQTRDFTFVADAVDATVRAAWRGSAGDVFNVGGGARVALLDVLPVLEELVGRNARVKHSEAQEGDARHTAADITRAGEVLGYRPAVDLREGLFQQVQWQLGRQVRSR